MDDLTPLLRAVAARPGDDTPRLVLADWLDERGRPGDAGRAEFIRLQIELARLDPSDNRAPALTAKMRRCGVFTAPGTVPFFDHLPTPGCKIGFRRGFIESIDTAIVFDVGVDASGFDLVPLSALRTGATHIETFRRFAHLRWLEYTGGRDAKPARLLELFGPAGCFRELETLSLPYLNAACLEAGVVPRFELPRLRNFALSTDSFYNLGVFAEAEADADDYGESRTWVGLPDHLPKNAIPSAKSPLERFVWHSDDDSDHYRDGDRFWPGPTMESLLASLKQHRLKQVEVAVDWDDHENGGEGANAAAYQRNPLGLCPTLECVTVDRDGLALLGASTKRLKGLRVYADTYYDVEDPLFAVLDRPVCSELESLHVEGIEGAYVPESATDPAVNFARLRSLSGLPLGRLTGCQFPSLLSLSCHGVKALLKRKWPKLQTLRITSDEPSDLQALAQSDCCPSLTTLMVGDLYRGYPASDKTDFSFLAKCPHMPHLSLVQIVGYPADRTWIVADGELVAVRADVMLDDLKPRTVYRISEVF